MRCVLWTGSRGWQDINEIVGVAVSLPKPFRSIVGDADGFDALVWQVLTRMQLPRWRYDAKWKQYGRAAGHKRNTLMLDVLQRIDPEGFVIAGWDGSSRGTKNCIDQAEGRGLSVWKVAYLPSEVVR